MGLIPGDVVSRIEAIAHDNQGKNAKNRKSQLPLFRYRHDLIGISAAWWLRDVVSAANFANVNSNGNANNNNASNTNGIRPDFGGRISPIC